MIESDDDSQPRYRSVEGGTDSRGLSSILPRGVVAVVAVGAVAPDLLFPGEAALVANAVEHRRLEFARGRSCARRAFALLGIEPSPVLAENRAPIWPPGVVGSITHCREYCAAAVARATQCSALGIDVETLRTLEQGVDAQILSSEERRQLQQLDPAIPWSCVVFSMKEATYKAYYPVTRRWLDFHEVEVHLDVARGRFEARLSVDQSFLSGFSPVIEGRFCIESQRVLTAVVIS